MDELIIDLNDALDRVQDDKELLLELFDIFEEDFHKKRKEIEKYYQDRNSEMVRNIAHSIKGAAGNISAVQVRDICLKMEESAAKDDLGLIPESLIQLDAAFEQYQNEARKIKEEYRVL